jgi:hypothetical protein
MPAHADPQNADRAGGGQKGVGIPPVDRDGSPTDFASLRLEIDGRFTPRFQEIAHEHAFYWLAAWSYHHADALPDDVRVAFLVALSFAWPQAQGRANASRGRARMAADLAADGVALEVIARALHVSTDRVQRWVKEWQSEPLVQMSAGEDACQTPPPRVVVVEDGSGRRRVRDPARLDKELLADLATPAAWFSVAEVADLLRELGPWAGPRDQWPSPDDSADRPTG